MKQIIPFFVLTLMFTNSFAQKFTSAHTVGNQLKSYDKILVVAKAKGDAERAEIEDDFVRYFKKKDIKATPSYVNLPSSMLNDLSKDEQALENFVSKLKLDGYDGILVSSLVDSDETVEYNPSTYHAAAVPVRYGRFGRYYGAARVAVYEPGSVENHSVFVLESLLYDLRASNKENSLHWIGKIKVTDPTSFDSATDKYAKTVVKKLTKEAIQRK